MLSGDHQADFGKEERQSWVKKLKEIKKVPARLSPCSHCLSVESVWSGVVFLINVRPGAKYRLSYVF